MTRSPADSLDTVDSAPTGETDDLTRTQTEPINEAVIAALADAGIDIDRIATTCWARSTRSSTKS